MHELAIVNNLLEAVLEKMKEHQLQQVKRIKVVVGEAAGIAPESLEFCWSLCSENTPAAGAKLEIDEEPVAAVCSQCGARYLLVSGISCPRCGGGIEYLWPGREIYLDFIEGD